MFHSILLEPLLIVFSMRPDPFNTRNTMLVAYFDDQAVMVTFDVEYHSVVGQKVSAAMAVFNVLRSSPVRIYSLIEPSVQSCFRTRMLCGKLRQ